MNPKKMQAVMKQMGISQKEIDSSRVIIEKKDNSKIIIENPSVVMIKMQGQESFQISGDVREEDEEEKFNEKDIQTIIEKTGCSREKAQETIIETGDLAEAILKLSE